MATNFGSRIGYSALALIAAAVFAAPVAKATPITYDFTVTATSGRLANHSGSGSFSFDSSKIVPNGEASGPSALTSFDFTFFKYDFSTVNYDLSKLKTSILSFDAAGQLTSFRFSTLCSSCAWGFPSTNWDMTPGVGDFNYSVYPPRGVSQIQRGQGDVTFAAVAVPEPGSVGLFGAGALLIFMLWTLRRRAIDQVAAHGPSEL